ncbi:unnamed protein product [Gulo gulo]|uniref:Uncharacterized protein n=1 Tax=Gulo gulo TaxID=48420 RepID=A0A9X9M605_GULGU|nr:unnamed protein product [Gulo gulo]
MEGLWAEPHRRVGRWVASRAWGRSRAWPPAPWASSSVSKYVEMSLCTTPKRAQQFQLDLRGLLPKESGLLGCQNCPQAMPQGA